MCHGHSAAYWLKVTIPFPPIMCPISQQALSVTYICKVCVFMFSN